MIGAVTMTKNEFLHRQFNNRENLIESTIDINVIDDYDMNQDFKRARASFMKYTMYKNSILYSAMNVEIEDENKIMKGMNE